MNQFCAWIFPEPHCVTGVVAFGQCRALGTRSNKNDSDDGQHSFPVSGNILQGGSRRCAQEPQEKVFSVYYFGTEDK